jgi:hypothetical protein
MGLSRDARHISRHVPSDFGCIPIRGVGPRAPACPTRISTLPLLSSLGPSSFPDSKRAFIAMNRFTREISAGTPDPSPTTPSTPPHHVRPPPSPSVHL